MFVTGDSYPDRDHGVDHMGIHIQSRIQMLIKVGGGFTFRVGSGCFNQRDLFPKWDHLIKVGLHIKSRIRVLISGDSNPFWIRVLIKGGGNSHSEWDQGVN